MEHRRQSKLLSPLIVKYQCILTYYQAFKNKGTFKGDDLRRRREEQQVEIRRQKREENISKRRNFIPSTGPDSDDDAGGSNWDPPVR